jgi:serine/threonine-protein kinase RsbW
MTASSRKYNWATRVKAETAELARVRKFVEQVAAEAALEGERVFDLKVAVSEACANAMEHAGCDEVLLEISACLQAERLTFVIMDSGFFRLPCRPRDQVGIRGLGLPLMVSLMDEVSFARGPGGGTRVSLSVLLD